MKQRKEKLKKEREEERREEIRGRRERTYHKGKKEREE